MSKQRNSTHRNRQGEDASGDPDPLKKIEAIIHFEKLEQVSTALKKLGIGGFTFYDAKGKGRAKAHPMVARGTGLYIPEYASRVVLEIVASDDQVDDVVRAILDNAGTGTVGDGKIFITSIERAIDLASRKEGEKAV